MTALGSCKRWYSSRDLATHTTLKSRIEGQDTQEEEQKMNLHEELEEHKRRAFLIKDDRDCRKGDHLLLECESTDAFYFASDADNSDVEVKSDAESDDEGEDEDDTLALLAELEQIRKKITEEKLKKELEREEELKVKEAELVRGNSLLNNLASFSV